MKILLTGSNGLIGQKILSLLKTRDNAKILATSRQPDQFYSKGGYNFMQADLTDTSQLAAAAIPFKPDLIIHCAAMTQVDLCEQDQAACRRINVDAVRGLVEISQKMQARFLYLSTDFVFDGTSGPYREEDVPNPVNFYGQTKLEAEKIIQASGLDWTILRTILVYGTAPQLPHPNIVQSVVKKLSQKETLQMVTDQIRMPTLAEDLAEACVHAGIHKKTGLYHISGCDRVSIYEFAVKVAHVFDFTPSLVQPALSKDLQSPAKRPPLTGFILDKAKRVLDYRPHSLTEGLRQVKNQMK